MAENGITRAHQLTAPYNPAQNGVAERMNRTVVESARSIISHSKMPNEFWTEAVNTPKPQSHYCSGWKHTL